MEGRSRLRRSGFAAKPLPLPSGSIRWVDSAFYEPAGQDTYVATAATVGPWSLDAQHGGPPSALAARALERHEADERQRLARVAVDILRPIPVGKLSVRTRLVRPGRRITLAEAVMEADGVDRHELEAMLRQAGRNLPPLRGGERLVPESTSIAEQKSRASDTGQE